ncbi:MAG: hypothetical protein JSV31_04085 [Desulfobacterales bacterium]|jgi:hypothetical protein|nr:MAG: hypothetical protein JSV31_04085 [Desulfobacterales bacterium]
MRAKLYLDILPQPDNTTCGPTCLHAVYRYYDDAIPLSQIISEVPVLKEGGTLAVYLACHALQRGYQATIITYNLQIFDPTWSKASRKELIEKLKQQVVHKKGITGFQSATKAYLEFLKIGGHLRFEVLTAGLIRRYLKRSIPLLSGLSATYLYNSSRELAVGKDLVYDDIRGKTQGHFVILAGYDMHERSVLVADPFKPNPVAPSQHYHVSIYRLICAIMLGVLTYDGDMLIVEPHKRKRRDLNAS